MSAATVRTEPSCPVAPGAQTQASRAWHQAALAVLDTAQNRPLLLDSPAFTANEKRVISFRASWLLPTKADSSPSLPVAVRHGLYPEMCGVCRPPRRDGRCCPISGARGRRGLRVESRGSEPPAWGRAPGSSETRQSRVSVRLIFRISTRCLCGIRDPKEGSKRGPQEQSWAARPLPH